MKHGSPAEEQTRLQLQRLLARYDLGDWLFTRTVEIDERVIPHSHPVLTLSTRHLRDDLLLLATYMHEQSHWYFVDHPEQTDAAAAELAALYPELPVGYPDGAGDARGSVIHLAVNTFEYVGLQRTVGELAAQQVLAFWATDHYRALYRIVLTDAPRILAILRKHGLVPPGRRPSAAG